MSAGGEGRERELADVDRAIVFDEYDRPCRLSRLGSVETVKLFQVSYKVTAALGRAGVDDELARDMIGSVKNLVRYAASWSAWWPKRPSSTAALT